MINISKKNLHLWVLGFVFLFVVGFGIAYDGNQLSIYGHTIGEIEGVGGGGFKDQCIAFCCK